MKVDEFSLFCTCKSSHHLENNLDCSDPDMIIQAINDAIEEMNYSNWHADKFYRAINVIKKYCKEKGIPMRFVPGELEDLRHDNRQLKEKIKELESK